MELRLLPSLHGGLRGRRRLAHQAKWARSNDRGRVETALATPRQGEGPFDRGVVTVSRPLDHMAAEEPKSPPHEHVVRGAWPTRNLSCSPSDVCCHRSRRLRAQRWSGLLPVAAVGAGGERLPPIVLMADLVVVVGVAHERARRLTFCQLVKMHPSRGIGNSLGLRLPPLVLLRRCGHLVWVTDRLVLIEHEPKVGDRSVGVGGGDVSVGRRARAVQDLGVAQRKTLTLAQIEILRWVQDGCPGEERGDNGRRVSVAALRNRRLVTTKGSGPTWEAAITAGGKAYLEQVDSDKPPTPRASASVTEQLIADIVAAGGKLEIQTRSYGNPREPDYEQRAQAAIRHGRVPDGKRLFVRHVRHGLLELSLLDLPAEIACVEAITVPARVSRYHAAARVVRESPGQLGLSRPVSSRAGRIVHALAISAASHGFTISAPDVSTPRYLRARSSHPGAFVFRKGTCDLPVRITESSKEPGRPTLALERWGSTGRPSSWGDRRSWQLEDKLTDVLREFLVRVAEHEDREAEKRRDAERRRIEWEEAMVVARERHAEACRSKVLLDEVHRWETAAKIRGYLEAIGRRFPEDPDAAAWIAWASNYAENLDPLSSRVALPPAPQDPSPEDLRPFLGPLSPYGPDRH